MSKVRHVTVDDLYSMLTQGEKVAVIDCRQPGEYTGSLGHIKGSILIPLAQIPEQKLDISLETPVRIICRSGSRSIRAAQMLMQRGYADVASVDGGMLAWNKRGYPTE